jgi:ribonuclease HII
VQQSGLRALEHLLAEWSGGHFAPDPIVILDGSHNYLVGSPYHSLAIVKADGSVPAVSAASVVAKVARDNYLERLGRRHPGYGLADHKGYGTAEHQASLRRLGITREHRRSYAPIRALANGTAIPMDRAS